MRFSNYIYSVIWLIIILVICSIPGDNIPSTSILDKLYLDKVVHAFIYFVFFTLLKSDLIKDKRKFTTIFAFAFCVIYGIFIEILQGSFLTGRSAEINDVYANISGVIIAVISYKMLSNKLSFIKK